MRRYLAVLVGGSFALNWLWEMAQMFAYKEMAPQPWQQTVLTCTLATFGDVLATLFVYGLILLTDETRRPMELMESPFKMARLRVGSCFCSRDRGLYRESGNRLWSVVLHGCDAHRARS